MKYKIIKMNPDLHRTDVLRLWKQGLNNFNRDRFNWLYKSCPDISVDTFLAINKTGDVLGCASLYQRKFYFNSSKYKILIAIDFIVDKDFRVFGPALTLQKHIVNESTKLGYDIILAYPNQASIGVFKRVGYKEIGMTKAYSKLLHSHKIIKKITKSQSVAILLSPIIDLFLRLLDVHINISSYHTKNIKTCDKSFDTLLKKVVQKNEFVMDKSSCFLTWRYVNELDSDYEFYCLFNKENELLSYIVYYTNDNVIYVVDILFINFQILNKLFINFIAYCRKHKFDSIYISLLTNKKLEKVLVRNFFLKRQSTRMCLKFFSNSIKNKYIIDKLNEIFLFEGELDL